MAAAHCVVSASAADAQLPIVDFLNHQPLPDAILLFQRMSIAHVLEQKQQVDYNSR